MSIEIIPIVDRDAWLTRRKYDLNASTIGALFSCHPYTSALRLYVEKQGLIGLPEEPDNPAMRRGRIMEPSVAEAVREVHPEWRIEKDTNYYRDTELSIGATPDFKILGDSRGLGILQCKTALPSVFERDWTLSRPPLYTILQAQTEGRLVPDCKFVVVACLIDDFQKACHIYPIELHDATWEKIKAAAIKFWHDIDTGNQPTPDYGMDRDLLPLLMPHETDAKVIDLSTDNEVIAGLFERAELRKDIAKAEKRSDEIEAMLMSRMNDAAIAKVPDFSVTWRVEERKAYSVQAKSSRVLRIRDRRKPEE